MLTLQSRVRPIPALIGAGIVLLTAFVLSYNTTTGRWSPADFGAWTLRLTIFAAILVTAVVPWLESLSKRVRPQELGASAATTGASGISRRDFYAVAAMAALVYIGVTVYNSRYPRYEFRGTNEGPVWKIDRRTGETFYCVRRCMLVEMPDWYIAREGR